MASLPAALREIIRAVFQVARRGKPANIVAMQVQLAGKQLIAGVWFSAGGNSLHAVNPATGEALAPAFVHATAVEVDAAMQAAQRVFAITRELPSNARCNCSKPSSHKS